MLKIKPSTRRAAGATYSRPNHSVTPVVCGLRFFSKFDNPKPSQRAVIGPARRRYRAAGSGPLVVDKPEVSSITGVRFHGVHHVALLISNLERSLEFYQGILGLEINPDRPHHKLPYRGAWLWIGPEMIHLMELENPDPLTNRPEHGGRDRHFCIGATSIQPLVDKLKAANVAHTMSHSGRSAVFFRDPDMNVLEVVEQEPWR